jgi:asparagine synthase (glutamine-hydrolysing)
VAQQALAREFFGKGIEAWRTPGFSHAPRWDSTAALFRLFLPDLRREMQGAEVTARLLASLPADFGDWPFLAQDQYLEMRTLLAGYLLSSQGDRMLMAHSVEGRFPFLDAEVVELANSLPAAYKLRGLDEKHVLKRVARGLIPDSITERKKQPYRAPDALSFVGPNTPAWAGDLVSEAALREVGVFEPRVVGQLWRKCQAAADQGQYSNADNMALVGVLSTQLLHQELVRGQAARPPITFKTRVDRLAGDEARTTA